MTDRLLKVEGVVKSYGEVKAVANVSFSVSAGEIYGLVGANGAGKSTLIRMIAGLTDPDSGHVEVCGQAVNSRTQKSKRHIGYLPEEPLYYDRLSGEEYLLLVAGLKGVEPSGVAAEIEFFEMSAIANKWVGEYSLGMKKKLGLAAALIGAPDLLVIDEPLNGLDVGMMRKVRFRIETERELGRSVLLSSHVMSFVERTCDRVGVMHSGRLVAEGSPEELRLRSNLIDAAFEDVFFAVAK